MIINPSVGGGKGAGFSGTANISWLGKPASLDIAYLNENMQLVHISDRLGTAVPPSSIPVPQIVYISAPGKNEGMSCSGDFEEIRSAYYPAGKVIYVTGDITITSIGL